MYFGYQAVNTTTLANSITIGDEPVHESRPGASVLVYEQVGTIAQLPPGVTFERCLQLTPGDILTYTFEADQPVAFDLHYHAYGLMHYALGAYTTTSETRTYRPRSIQTYCLSWQNPGHEAIRLSWGHSPPQS